MILFIILVLILALLISVPYSKKLKSEHQTEKREDPRRKVNTNLTPDEKDYIENLLAFTGKEHFFDVTENERRKYIVSRVAKGFTSMEGWNTWDESIHSANGQYERMSRAFNEATDMELLCYDPIIKRAKIRGTSNIYVTGHQGCSCPDFKDRKLPCKHMYFLMAELDENPYQEIMNDTGAPLDGINFFTTGRFPEYGHTKGIVETIIKSGGQWTSNWKEADVIVTGNNPSYSIMEKNKECGLLEIKPEDIQSLFADM